MNNSTVLRLNNVNDARMWTISDIVTSMLQKCGQFYSIDVATVKKCRQFHAIDVAMLQKCGQYLTICQGMPQKVNNRQ